MFYLGTCQKLAGGEGGWKQREGHNFLSCRKGRGHEKWAIKRERVMQICVREVLYFVKKTLGEIGEPSDNQSWTLNAVI